MLNNISWISYLVFISLVLFVYYLVVLFCYYRAELRQLFVPGDGRIIPGADKKMREAVANSDPDLFPVVHVLMGKLGHCIAQAKNEHKSRDELLAMLQTILGREPGVRDTAFEPAIANYLREEAMKQCAVLLSDEELRRIWDE